MIGYRTASVTGAFSSSHLGPAFAAEVSPLPAASVVLQEDETAFAEDTLNGWALDRYGGRRAVMSMMPHV